MASFTNLWLTCLESVVRAVHQGCRGLHKPTNTLLYRTLASMSQRRQLLIPFGRFAKPSLMQVAWLCLGATLITATSVSAGSSAPIAAASSSRPAVSPPSELIAEIKVKVASLLGNGMHLRSIDLGCEPPADAVLEQVAPGMTKLNSRGFVVELRSRDRTLACSATLNAEHQILVAVREIAQGEELSAADFELRWTDAFDSTDALAALPATGPFVASTAIRVGQPLLAIQLTRPLAIRPGDLVTVLVKNGPVTVRTQLEARSAAAVGDSVSVINPETGMPVTVTVTGEKAAELVMQ
jgi:flagella basal body P-ring formation protein FlgA